MHSCSTEHCLHMLCANRKFGRLYRHSEEISFFLPEFGSRNNFEKIRGVQSRHVFFIQDNAAGVTIFKKPIMDCKITNWSHKDNFPLIKTMAWKNNLIPRKTKNHMRNILETRHCSSLAAKVALCAGTLVFSHFWNFKGTLKKTLHRKIISATFFNKEI